MKELKGIGGWLVVAAIGIVCGPIIRMQRIVGLVGFGVAAYLHPESYAWSPLSISLLWISVAGYILMFIFSLALLALFFSKRRGFRSAIVTYLGGSIALGALDIWVNFSFEGHAMGEPWVVWSVVELALLLAVVPFCWMGYYLRSKRVVNTFVN